MSHLLERAKGWALEVYNDLKPHCIQYDSTNVLGEPIKCYRIKVAGDICRNLPAVNTIQIVCLPDNINHFAMTLHQKYGIQRFSHKDRMKEFNVHGMKCQVWMPKNNDYFRILTILQSAPEFAHKISSAIFKRGYVATRDGIRLRSECSQEKDKWKIAVADPTPCPSFESQEQFFFWLGMNYTQPAER